MGKSAACLSFGEQAVFLLVCGRSASRLSIVKCGGVLVREYVWLECTETGLRNYRVIKETRGTERLELMKYCPRLRRHTLHKESRKK